MESFRLKIYMVNQPRWNTLQQRINEYKMVWYRAVNAPKLEVDIDYIKVSDDPGVQSGRLTRSFVHTLTASARFAGYDAIGIILPESAIKKWGLSKTIRGHYFVDQDKILDFYVIADERTTHTYPTGMKVNRFLKTLAHEMMHGITRLAGYPDFTHEYDYDKHDIFAAYTRINWKVVPLWQRVLALKTQLIDLLKV